MIDKKEFRDFKLLVYILLYIIISNVAKSDTVSVIADIAAGIMLFVLVGCSINDIFKYIQRKG